MNGSRWPWPGCNGASCMCTSDSTEDRKAAHVTSESIWRPAVAWLAEIPVRMRFGPWNVPRGGYAPRWSS